MTDIQDFQDGLAQMEISLRANRLDKIEEEAGRLRRGAHGKFGNMGYPLTRVIEAVAAFRKSRCDLTRAEFELHSAIGHFSEAINFHSSTSSGSSSAR